MTFADVFDLQMGKTPSRDNSSYWGGDNVWVSIADMKDRKFIDSSKETITNVAVKETGQESAFELAQEIELEPYMPVFIRLDK